MTDNNLLTPPTTSGNRRGTMSKAKSFRRPALNMELSAAGNSTTGPIYKFLNGEEYSGPDISTSQTPTPPPSIKLESPECKIPVFLGANGTIYNKYYIPIKIVGIPDEKPNTYKESYLQFNSLDQIYSKYPEYLESESFLDYEQNLITWKRDILKNLGVLQLPHALGRTYSRPKAFNDRFLRKDSEASNGDDSLNYEPERKLTDSDQQKDNSSSSTTTSATQGGSNNNNDQDSPTITTTSTTNTTTLGRDRSGSDTSTGSFEGGQLDGTSPIDGSPSYGGLASFISNGSGNRSRSNSSTLLDHRLIRSNSLLMKQQQGRLSDSGDFKRGGSMLNVGDDPLLIKDPWDAQLILTEPIPDLYNTFEEYEFAMRNWSIEVVSKTSVLPPQPNQFVQLYSNSKLSESQDGTSLNGANSGVNGIGGGGKNKSLRQEIESILRDTSKPQVNWRVRSGILPIQSEEDYQMDLISKESKLELDNYKSRHFNNLDIHIPVANSNGSKPITIWKKYDQFQKATIAEPFEKQYRRRFQLFRQNSVNQSHGYWSHRLLMPHFYRSWRESLNRKAQFLPVLTVKAARRKDIDSETDGGKVDHNYLIPEISIQFQRLQYHNMNIQHILGMFDQSQQQQLLLLGGDPNSPTTPTPTAPGTPSSKDIQSSSSSSLSQSSSSSLSQSTSLKQSTPPTLLSTKETLASLSSKHLDPIEDKKNYLNLLQQYDKRLMFSFRFDSLNSWYEEFSFKNYLGEFERFNSQSGQLDMNSIWSLVCNNEIPLDKFQEFIDMDLKMYAVSTSQSSQGTIHSPSTRTAPSTPLPTQGLQGYGSPPSRTGSTGSFSFGSPISSSSHKLPLSPTHGSVLSQSGMESPRQVSNHLGSSVSSNSTLSSTINNSGGGSGNNSGSPRSQIINQSNINNSSGGTSILKESSATQSVSVVNHSFIQTFLQNIITTNSFPELLNFFDKTNSPLSKSKISSLVILSLTSSEAVGNKSNILFESIVLSKDIQSLYRMAIAISYFDVVPLDIFPYPVHLNEMFTVKLMEQGSLLEVVKLVFMYYYLQIIQDRLPHYLSQQNNNNGGNSNILNQFPSLKRDAAERIAIFISNDKDLLKRIFIAIGRKSKFISHSYLFILLQLLKMTDTQSLQSQLKAKDTLLPLMKDLCFSKYLHAKFAARRLFTILQSDYKDFLLSEYYDPSNIERDSSTLLSDLLTPDNQDSDSSSLLSELVYNLSSSVLSTFHYNPPATISSSSNASTSSNSLLLTTSKPIFKFILNETIFYQIFNALVKSKKHDENLENLSKLFALVCKTLYKCNLIRKTDSVRMVQKKKDDNQNEIQITPICLFDILSFLGQTNYLSEKYTQSIKTNLLIALRHLLKSADIFDVLKKEEKFYNKLLIPSCRDPKNPDFNRNSWKLFFQIIRYHPGQLEVLDKGKYLIQIMDIISLNSGNVILNNALYYLAKLFALVVYEQKKRGTGSDQSNSIKHTEKDVKYLVSFFNERHLFIKLHMIYKRFAENKIFPGFIKLANLYQVISTLPICSKLAKDTMKNPEYKEGMQQIAKLFKFEELAPESSSNTPTNNISQKK